MHEATREVLRFFDYGHLPVPSQAVSRPFHDLAHGLVGDGPAGKQGPARDIYGSLRRADARPDGPELTVALRKLLEAKDAAVRAALPR